MDVINVNRADQTEPNFDCIFNTPLTHNIAHKHHSTSLSDKDKFREERNSLTYFIVQLFSSRRIILAAFNSIFTIQFNTNNILIFLKLFLNLLITIKIKLNTFFEKLDSCTLVIIIVNNSGLPFNSYSVIFYIF